MNVKLLFVAIGLLISSFAMAERSEYSPRQYQAMNIANAYVAQLGLSGEVDYSAGGPSVNESDDVFQVIYIKRGRGFCTLVVAVSKQSGNVLRRQSGSQFSCTSDR